LRKNSEIPKIQEKELFKSGEGKSILDISENVHFSKPLIKPGKNLAKK
jgi:hypothetical protein